MRAVAFILCLLSASAPLRAEDWKMMPGDQLLAQRDLTQRVSGQSLVFYDQGQSDFGLDGSYNYTYGAGGDNRGRYIVGTDSTICITYDTGASRCDLYVLNRSRLVVVTEDGMRFPVRS